MMDIKFHKGSYVRLLPGQGSGTDEPMVAEVLDTIGDTIQVRPVRWNASKEARDAPELQERPVNVFPGVVEPAMLILLDLNGVLGLRKRSKTFSLRPNLSKFIQFVLQNFAVGVWTSAEQQNGNPVIDKIFGPLGKGLVCRRFRHHCRPDPSRRNGTTKDLCDFFAHNRGWHEGNTIIVDDSFEKCSHLNRALIPLAYERVDDEDKELLGVMEVLQSILSSPPEEHEGMLEAARERTRSLIAAAAAAAPNGVAAANAPAKQIDKVSDDDEEAPPRDGASKGGPTAGGGRGAKNKDPYSFGRPADNPNGFSAEQALLRARAERDATIAQ